MKDLKILSHSILKKKKLMVIGNSGVTKQDQLYLEQNRNDIDIVRFNNYATRSNITHTNPVNECDILFSTLDLHSGSAKPRDLVIGIPFPFKARRNIDNINKWYPKSNHWMIDPYRNIEMNDELLTGTEGYIHPFPSIGFTALWHMRNWACDMYICGFNWYNSGSKFQGWDMKDKNYPKHWNHNYPREILWIYNNLLNKINIKFSNECEELIVMAGRITK